MEASRRYSRAKKIWANGSFQEAGERELVLEFITLLEQMENEIFVFAAPNTTHFSFFANLQENKQKIIEHMREFIENIDETEEAQIAMRRSRGKTV